MDWKEFIVTGMKLIKSGCDMADDCTNCPIGRYCHPDHVSCTDFLDYIENFMEINGRPVFLVYDDIDGWKTVDGDCFEPIKEI